MSVCLNMIVKDEAHVIRRCLASVRPLIDSWVIVDTGSSDGTQEIIRNCLADVPGTLHTRPWKNFGHNRSESLALARETASYSFVIDADDLLIVPHGFKKPNLSADAYSVLIRDSGTQYRRTCLFANRLAWRYVGVLHEYPEADAGYSLDILDDFQIERRIEGGRSKIGLIEKYLNDAALLEQALQDEPTNARYVFYLAQSYRDAGRLEKSLANYQRRAAMGGWEEEVWYAHYEIAMLSERLGLADEIITQRYLEAYQVRPKRIEPLVKLARRFREKSQFALAHLFAEKAMSTPTTKDFLFVDMAAYEWCALDEYAIASYWIGNYEACRDACEKLLSGKKLPEQHRARVAENLRFARAGMITSRSTGK